MKYLILFAVLGMGSNALADEGGSTTISYRTCSNGDIETMGDTFFSIDLFDDGIGFFPYESSFSFDSTDFNYEKGTYTIVNKTATAYAEGTEELIVVNAILTLNADQTELNVAISQDRGAFSTHTMKCELTSKTTYIE